MFDFQSQRNVKTLFKILARTTVLKENLNDGSQTSETLEGCEIREECWRLFDPNEGRKLEGPNMYEGTKPERIDD